MSVPPDNKAFETLRARAALAGYRLLRTDERDGQVMYLVERSGIVRALRTIEDVESLFVSTSGVRP
ncbi:hypothetical protein [Rubrivivax albus]|uniref:Uncharacterized protein n=1 Tax=Rubrivivax albus TaxID=2499835 RepID=A0A3S2USC8_9BURK|nr:hypothetical protein [Rubrivivax albus]RVT53963.1 hypothetical protein ENE75_03545 [Rubrivivax albus]